MYTLVIPVHVNECIITKAACVDVKGHEGYEMRVYRMNRPFDVYVYEIKEDGTTPLKRSVAGKRAA